MISLGGSDQIAGLIEFEHGRSGLAAWPMNDPDVIPRIDGDADGLTEDPMVGQWLPPERVHFKSGRLDRGRGR